MRNSFSDYSLANVCLDRQNLSGKIQLACKNTDDQVVEDGY